VLLATLLLLSAAAQAQDAETAASLQDQLRAWFATWPGITPIRPEPSLSVQAEDNHYRIEWPLSAPDNKPIGDFTATLRSRDGGRWLLESPRLAPGTIELTLSQTAAQNAKGPARMSISLGDQHGRAVIDPSFATPSTLALEVNDLATVTDSADGRQTQHIDRYVLNARVVPAPDGRIDIDSDSSTDGLRGTVRNQQGHDVDFSAQAMRGDFGVKGVSREAATAVISAITAVIPLMPARPEAGHPVDPAQMALLRKGLRALVEALRGSLTSVQSNGTINNMRFSIADAGDVALRQVTIAMNGEAPNDRLHASWDLSLDGIMASKAPPDIADLVPTAISLRPSVMGIDMAQLTQLAVDATAETPDGARLAAEASALWNDPAAHFGMESLAIAVGPTRLEGSGQVHFITPGEPELVARLTAAGLDTLLTRAATKPAMQRALPVLLILRGMGRSEGNRLVWDVVARKGHVLVNGLDMKMLEATAGERPPTGEVK
jgi:hypothetical protein